MRRIWKVRPVEETSVQQLSQALGVPPLIARLLIHRGVTSRREADDFLCTDLSTLADPELMKDLAKAVDLIRSSLSEKQSILLVGDYDVDGLTGTALLYLVLRGLGGKVSWHIPHRMTDGYGLKAEVVQKAGTDGVKLLVTVDCGTTSFEELRLAKRLGIQTIVVDHHELLPAGPPPASAFVNPLQPGCRYPNKNLSSVGVAFTLARGLLEGHGAQKLWDHLDLVALGTVADVAPLIGENRVLVKLGLHRLKGTSKPGLKALLAKARLDSEVLTSEGISFMLAPRLNASGRMGSAEAGFRLLITDDPEEARELAKGLERQNKLRGSLEREAFARALSKVEREINFRTDRVIILDDERWHPGVVGIIAARLASRFHRPAVVIALNGPICRGSARSIRDFHLVEALEAVKEHLVEFGGHPAAAGLTIDRKQIGPFRQALNRVGQERLDSRMLTPCLDLDGELPLGSLTEQLMRDMDLLAPFGAGNPYPVFLSDDVQFPPEAERAPFSPYGIRRVVQSPLGNSFHLLEPRTSFWEGWNIRRIKGGSVRMAYSPTRRWDKEGPRIELKLCDLKVG